MKIHFLQSAAVALGLITCNAAVGQYPGYGGHGGGGSQVAGAPPERHSGTVPREIASGYGAPVATPAVPVHPSLRPLPSTGQSSQQRQPSQTAPQPLPAWGGAVYQPPQSFARAGQSPQAAPAAALSGAPPAAPGYVHAPPFGPNPYRTVATPQQPEQVGSGQLPMPAANYDSGSGPAMQAPNAPMPSAQQAPRGTTQHGGTVLSHSAPHSGPPAAVGAGLHAGGDCQTCNVGQIYHEAAAGPWHGGLGGLISSPGLIESTPAPLRNWFAGTNLLFLDYEQEYDRRLVFPDAMPSDTNLRTSQVNPGSQVGFETFVGRYFACGKYAVMGSYFFLDPDREEFHATAAAAGNYRVAMPLWNRLYLDSDGDGTPDDFGVIGDATDDNLYTAYDSALAYRIRRDVSFQGLQLNFVGFGIGGASRLGLGAGCAPCGPGCGGMCGPMTPGCNSRLQFAFSHGLRWFQFRDEFELAASLTDTVYGNTADDLYHSVETENNLLGYQVGSRIAYCIMPRVSLYASGLFGIYGNQVDYTTWMGANGVSAQAGPYYPSYQDQPVHLSRSDTVFSTLGELDLGVGVRLARCWTLTGGYRLISLTGVATSVGSIADDPANIWQGHLNAIDDSLILHGGYVGLQYNW